MKNCHKRWKKEREKERKAEEAKRKEGFDSVMKMLKELGFFLRKHPDQANYEFDKMQAMK